MTYIVLAGLKYSGKQSEDEINKYFKERGWGKVKFKLKFNTLPGFGGEGGRSDVVFHWTAKGSEVGKFSIQRFQIGGISWLGDYVNNNRGIIPLNVLERLNKMVTSSGDYEIHKNDGLGGVF
jgi:hypothetical protein